MKLSVNWVNLNQGIKKLFFNIIQSVYHRKIKRSIAKFNKHLKPAVRIGENPEESHGKFGFVVIKEHYVFTTNKKFFIDKKIEPLSVKFSAWVFQKYG